MRRPLIAGNWKMNGLRGEAAELSKEILDILSNQHELAADLLVCPPFTALAAVGDVLRESRVSLGAQDCHTSQKGAHTGDVSPAMLKDAGCAYVLIGHSERRTEHGESDAEVKAKAISAQSNGLCAVICVGETEEQRESGKALETVREQVSSSVPENSTADNMVIAYEPVWAIGTGKVATPADVVAMHHDIRATLGESLGMETANEIRILYGGSMKPENAEELLAIPDVDGGLIGGASLQAIDFVKIAQSC